MALAQILHPMAQPKKDNNMKEYMKNMESAYCACIGVDPSYESAMACMDRIIEIGNADLDPYLVGVRLASQEIALKQGNIARLWRSRKKQNRSK